MQYFLYALIIIFLYFNYRIIYSDLKYKKILNKYLGYLLFLIPFYYVYIFFNFSDVNYLLFTFQIFITFLISFILYYFGIWAAGDAKYLLVLALFIPYIGIIPFIGNIALLTIFYLLGYFFYFYSYKIVKHRLYRQKLFQNIKIDFKERWKTYKKDKSGTTINIILKWLLIFLIIFVSIRLLRLYIFKFLFETTEQSRLLILLHYFEKYNIYLVFLIVGIIFTIIFGTKKIIFVFREYLKQKNKNNSKKAENILIIIFSLILIFFISYEYYINPEEIKIYLLRIFTIYILVYIIARILIYSYKITFILGETKFKNIKELKIGDFIDKIYLSQIFGTQKCLGLSKNQRDKNKLLFPDPKKSILDIKNPIGEKELNLIQKIYKITNNYHKKNKTKGFQEIIDIKTLSSFSFAPYILLGFLITFFFENKIWEFLIKILYKLLGETK